MLISQVLSQLQKHFKFDHDDEPHGIPVKVQNTVAIKNPEDHGYPEPLIVKVEE